jgi:hypothetical protein
MSTVAMPLSLSPTLRPKAQPVTCSSLVDAAKVGFADRVLIMGRNVLEQVMALAHSGCRSLTSLRADASYPKDEPVDVLWFSGIDDVKSRLMAALSGSNVPRIIVIEINGAETDGRLRPVVAQLRSQGFARFTLHRTLQGVAVMAARPAWLQQVI